MANMSEEERRKLRKHVLMMGAFAIPMALYFLYRNNKKGIDTRLGYNPKEKKVKKKFNLRDYFKSEVQSVKNSFKNAWTWIKR